MTGQPRKISTDGASEKLSDEVFSPNIGGEPEQSGAPITRPGITDRLKSARAISSLKSKDFLLLWLSTIALGGGFWLHQLVVGWLTYDLTKSALLTTIAVAGDNLPYLLIGPVGGILADMWDCRKLLAGTFLLQLLITAGLSAIILAGYIQTWHIFVYILLMGTSWALAEPARTIAIPKVVPRNTLVNAFALSTMGFNTTRVLVPAIGGLLIAMLGSGQTLWLGASLFLMGAAAVAMMKIPKTSTPAQYRKSGTTQLLESARYVKKDPLVLALVLILGLIPIMMIPAAHGMFPVYAAEIFKVDSKGLGLLLSIFGGGALAGTIVVASIGAIRYQGRVLALSIVLIAIGMIVFANMGSIATAVPAILLMSSSLMCVFIVQGAMMQAVLPDRLRGSVTALSLMVYGFYPVGGAIFGGIAQVWSAPVATTVAAIALVVCLLGILVKFPQIWRFEMK